MRLAGRESRPWLAGIASVVAGLAVQIVMLYAQPLHYAAVEWVNFVLAYPEKPALYLRNIVQLSSNWVLERATLHERIEKLELERQAMAEALQRANVLPAARHDSYVRAVVTLRYPQDWWHELRIDKGRRDGVVENAAVTSEGYFVGRISRVGNDYAWVELITASTFLLAAVVDQTRDLGVVNGDGAGRLSLLYIPEERPLSRGMTVSTSLMNDVIPPGLPVGRIIASESDEDGYRDLKLSAGAHLTQLYNVEVFTAKGTAAQ